MDEAMNSALLGALIGPVVTFFLSILGFWIQDRSQLRSEQQRLRQSQAEVAFIDKWASAYRKFAPSDNNAQVLGKAQVDLEAIYSVISISMANRAPHIHPLRAFVKEALLLKVVHSRIAKVIRIIYYAALAWAFIGAAALWSITFEEGITFTNVIISLLTLVLLGLLPAWMLHALTRKIDRVLICRNHGQAE